MSKDVYTIELQDGPVPFEPVIQSKLLSSIELTRIINRIFTEVFKDYEGCSITNGVANDGTIRSISLFFKDKGNGQMVPLGTPQNGQGSALVNRIMSHNARLSTNKTYRLSDDVRQVLEPLMIKAGAFNQNVDWNKSEVEIPEPNQLGGMNIYLRVDNIDINKILKIYFGGTDKDKDEIADYNVSYVRALVNGASLLKIDRANKIAVDKLIQEAGLMAQNTNAISISRGV